MERHQVTAAFPTPCNSLCVRTWELRHGDDKVNKWSIPSKRRRWKRAQKTVQWKQYQYNDIQGDWWNGTQHQRHEKEPKRSRNIQWCFKKRFSDVTPAKASNGMCSLWSWVEKCTNTAHHGQERDTALLLPHQQ